MTHFSVFVFAALLFAAAVYGDGNPSGSCGKDCTYECDLTNHVLTISGSGWMKNYTTSSGSSGYPPWWRDCREDIYEVVVGEKIEALGDFVFYDLPKLTKVEVKGSLSYTGGDAFQDDVSLTTAIFHEVNCDLRYGLFTGCVSLKDLVIEGGAIQSILGPFKDCISLTEVNFPKINGMIDQYSFYNCSSITKVNIGGTVTGIMDNAFTSCSNLKDVTISGFNGEINKLAFPKCYHLENVKINGAVTNSLDFLSGSTNFPDLRTVEITSVGSLQSNTFQNRKNLTRVVIGQLNSNMGASVFADCKNLTTVSIGGSAKFKTINNGVFNGCKSLTKFVIPDTVQEIFGKVFMSCTSLTRMSIPSSVRIMMNEVFSGCSNLEYVWYAGTTDPGASATGVFDGCDKLNQVNVPTTYSGDTFCGKTAVQSEPPPPDPSSSSSELPTPTSTSSSPAGSSAHSSPAGSSTASPAGSSTTPARSSENPQVSVGTSKRPVGVFVSLFLALSILLAVHH